MIIACLAILFRHEFTPGQAARAPHQWPASSRLARDPQLPTLVMVIHPRCPCSQASLEELHRLVSRHPGKARTIILFVRPGANDPAWENTPNWKSARLIAAAQLQIDPDAREASQFDARTSGQTYLYSPSGQLLFSGGITGSRGHAGDNASGQTLSSLLAGTTSPQPPAATEVYGCPAAPKKGFECPCQP